MMKKRLSILAALCIAFSVPVAGEPMPALSVHSACPGNAVAAWRAGDKLLVYHDGTVYDYVTGGQGDEALFLPSSEGQDADAFDPSKPLNVYFNVDAVSGRGEAFFSVKAEQRPGELSGRLPQWGRVEGNARINADKKSSIPVKMSPLATLLEISASSAAPFRVDRLALLPQATASGFTAVIGAKINPVSGKVTLPRPTGRPVSIGLSTDGADLSSRPVFSVIVAGLNPGGSGLVADFFRGRNNNMRAVLLAGQDAGKESGPAILKLDLGEKKVGISTTEEFADFAAGTSKGDRHGLKYCDEDGVVCLNADIDLSSLAGAGQNWAGVNDLRADFDGKGHSLYGYRISRASNAALFINVSASVRNVNFGRPGDYIEVKGGNYANAAPIAMAGNPNAVIEGCMNRSEVRSTADCKGTVQVGGIVARSAASLHNCANLGKVTLDSPESTGAKYVGGIVGNVYGDMGTVANFITSCVNRGEVSCSSSLKAWAGGIAGRVSETAKAWRVEKCTNRGKIFISSIVERVTILSCLGGIAAEMAAPSNPHGASHLLKDCRNAGPVFTNADGRLFMGGVVGMVRGTMLDHCTNEAEVSHLRGLDSDVSLECNFVNMGGIVGFLSIGSAATGCENAASGKVSSDYAVPHRLGGIAGVCSKSYIEKCSNAAPVQLVMPRTAKALCAAGGICGMQDGAAFDRISSCSNTGDIALKVNATGLNAAAGGILAVLAKGGVSACRNSGNVSAINELALPDMHCLAGGVVARVYRNDVSGVEHCSNKGKISADAPYSPSKGLIAAGEIVGHND